LIARVMSFVFVFVVVVVVPPVAPPVLTTELVTAPSGLLPPKRELTSWPRIGVAVTAGEVQTRKVVRALKNFMFANGECFNKSFSGIETSEADLKAFAGVRSIDGC
jgi:hypothetical protein